ncbi:MAG: hypothetical protein JJT95_04975 [Pararhodobacter sp.]|nr:hypothetical protein [Pararhodobacter sp.]
MEVIRKRARHSLLVGRMAEALGIDLEEAALRGHFDDAEHQRAIARCTGCEGGADCPHWLEAHDTGASVAPAYCRNAGLFATLSGR